MAELCDGWYCHSISVHMSLCLVIVCYRLVLCDTTDNCDTSVDELTLQEVTSGIQKLKSGYALGLDNINFRITEVCHHSSCLFPPFSLFARSLVAF